MDSSNQAVELGQLLCSTVASVVQAQEKLDQYTESRRLAYMAAEQGSLAIPPIWYTFQNVAIELELSSSIAQVVDVHGQKQAHIVSRTLDPTSVGLYGYKASAGMRVSIHMAPHGFVPIKDAPSEANEEETDQ